VLVCLFVVWEMKFVCLFVCFMGNEICLLVLWEMKFVCLFFGR
jgi:hypothetical protein